MQSFIENYKNILQHKYAQFEGRATRREFWSFVLVNAIVGIIISIVDSIIGLHDNSFNLNSLYSLAVFIPSLALAVRRLHDIGKSGWWELLVLIPIIGWIVLLIFAIMESQPGANQYGPNVTNIPPVPPAAV